jgi:hypothetical protein
MTMSVSFGGSFMKSSFDLTSLRLAAFSVQLPFLMVR